MMKKIINLIVLVSISMLINSCSEDKLEFSEVGKITGKVVEAQSFEPIVNAKVSINPTNNTVFTDEEGNFEMDEIITGDYSIKAEKEGYLAGLQPGTVSANASINVVFELEDSDALNKPPFAPELLSPEDGSVGLELEVELIWSTATDPDGDDLVYGIHIRNDYDDSLIQVQSVTDTTYVLSDLQHGVKYFWQVSVNDSYNNDVLTPISSFETTSYPENRYFYVREENNHSVIYSANADGESLASTSSAYNSWRPRKSQSAQLVAFLRVVNTETHLFTMKPDGTDVQQVTNAVPLTGFKQDEIDFSWSSSGDKLIYPSFDKLYQINKDGSGNQLLYQTTDGSLISECDWSYDGSIIALKTNDIDGYSVSIYTIDMSGNVLTTILSGVSGAAGGLNLSITNQKLLYTYDISGFEDASYRQLDTRMFIYDFASSTALDISEDKDAGTNDLDPRFTPNEAQVIFVNTSNDGLSEKKVYLVDIDGDGRESLFDNAFMPDWE